MSHARRAGKRTVQVQRRERLILLQGRSERHAAFSTDAVPCAPRPASDTATWNTQPTDNERAASVTKPTCSAYGLPCRRQVNAAQARAPPHTGRITRAQRRVCKPSTQGTRHHTHKHANGDTRYQGSIVHETRGARNARIRARHAMPELTDSMHNEAFRAHITSSRTAPSRNPRSAWHRARLQRDRITQTYSHTRARIQEISGRQRCAARVAQENKRPAQKQQITHTRVRPLRRQARCNAGAQHKSSGCAATHGRHGGGAEVARGRSAPSNKTHARTHTHDMQR